MKNTNKYDKMLAANRERSKEKITQAKAAIRKMVEDGEKVSVTKLMNKTGLSRGFFYKNMEIRREIDEATECQAGIADPRRRILDQAMESRIQLLQQQLVKYQHENEILRDENEKLRKTFRKRNLCILKNL